MQGHVQNGVTNILNMQAIAVGDVANRPDAALCAPETLWIDNVNNAAYITSEGIWITLLGPGGGGGSVTADNGLSVFPGPGNIQLGDGALNRVTAIDTDSFLFTIGTAIAQLLVNVGKVAIGDPQLSGNGTNVVVEDAIQRAAMEAGPSNVVVNGDTGISQIGDVNNVSGGMIIEVDNTSSTIKSIFGNVAGGIKIENSAGLVLVTLGDYDSIMNQTKITLDDTAKLITFQTAQGKYLFAVVPQYVDNTQALVGGLSEGMIYAIPEAVNGDPRHLAIVY